MALRRRLGRLTFHVVWSAEDREWVGLCKELPSLSWLAPTYADALAGILRLVADAFELGAKDRPRGPGGPARDPDTDRR